MVDKLSFKDKEFEKNKREILRRMKADNPSLSMVADKTDSGNEFYRDNNSRRYAWEYEIEEYRKKKNLEMFYKIGAFSGILSLIITIIDKITPIKEFADIAFNYIFK